MPLIHDEGIVLGRVEYSETSQVLVLFTREHGKVRAIARGIKRSTKTRFAAGIDLLDIGSVVVSIRHERQEGLATLTEWKQVQSLSGLREKLARINGAQYAAEITSHLTEDWDPHPELFDALVEALSAIADAKVPLVTIVEYQIALLTSIGALPRFDACIACGRGEDLTFFSSFEGGLVCRHCEAGRVEKHEVSGSTLTALRGLGTGGNRPIGAAVTGSAYAPAFSLLNYHISHLMGREPRLALRIVPRRAQRRVN